MQSAGHRPRHITCPAADMSSFPLCVQGSSNELVEEQMEDLHLTSQQGQPISFTPAQVKGLTKAQVTSVDHANLVQTLCNSTACMEP